MLANIVLLILHAQNIIPLYSMWQIEIAQIEMHFIFINNVMINVFKLDYAKQLCIFQTSHNFPLWILVIEHCMMVFVNIKAQKKFLLPWTHSFSRRFSMWPRFIPSPNREDKIKIPKIRNFPACFWITQPNWNSCFWMLLRSINAGLFPVALPCKDKYMNLILKRVYYLQELIWMK